MHYAIIQEQAGALKHSDFQNVSSQLINFKKERHMIFLAMESTDKHLLGQNIMIQGGILRSSRLSFTWNKPNCRNQRQDKSEKTPCPSQSRDNGEKVTYCISDFETICLFLVLNHLMA